MYDCKCGKHTAEISDMQKRSRIIGILRAQARLQRSGPENSLLRRQSIGDGNQECTAGRDAVMAGARPVVGKVNRLAKSPAALLLADNLQTTNDLSRRYLE